MYCPQKPVTKMLSLKILRQLLEPVLFNTASVSTSFFAEYFLLSKDPDEHTFLTNPKILDESRTWTPEYLQYLRQNFLLRIYRIHFSHNCHTKNNRAVQV
jgi:hypothetical protein